MRNPIRWQTWTERSCFTLEMLQDNYREVQIKVVDTQPRLMHHEDPMTMD